MSAQKDRLGNLLAIGDVVETVGPTKRRGGRYAGPFKAEVTGFTPKMVRVKYKTENREGRVYGYECFRIESPESPTVPEWQPIETAPKDSTAVLGFMALENGLYITAVCVFKHGGWVVIDFLNDEDVPIDLTHWMPLPKPPEVENE